MNEGHSITSWQGIHEEVLRRIHLRVWKPGDTIPNEADLAAEFGCARATVNRALRELAEAGLLERRRKAGTRVALNPVRKATLNIPVVRREIEGRGAAYSYALISSALEIPPPPVRARLGLGADTKLRHVRAVHFADGRPYVVEERWVNREAVPEIDEVDLSEISANEWLIRNVPFTSGDFAFEARNATPEIAELLGAREDQAVLVMTRTTWNGGMPITIVSMSYAPGYRIHTTI